MKKLLKSEICRTCEQYTGPIDVLKMAEKSKFSAIVHAWYMNSSLCIQLCMQKKKKKMEKGKRKKENVKEKNVDAESAESKQTLNIRLLAE